MSRFDVAVVGGGPAAALTGLMLARRGGSVVMIDRGDRRPVLGETLPPQATPVLQELGLWDRFLLDGHQPAHGNRSVWGGERTDHYDFIRSPYGSGWHLDRRRFDQMLRDGFVEAGGVLLERSRALSWPDLKSAPFLVEATGRSRKVARSQGIGTRAYDRLIGILGVAERDRATGAEVDSFTSVEAVENGWWYANPLPDGRLVLGYMTDPDLARRDNAFEVSSWSRLLSATSLMIEPRYGLPSTLRVVPADSSCLESFAGDGWLGVGDAAGTHDPLSSQGILSAMIQGRWAAEAIARGPTGLAGYQEKMRQAYARYLAEWMSYYAVEQRWPDSIFWRRRHVQMEKLFAA